MIDVVSGTAGLDDLAFQEQILPHVSRTFALTIPELPKELSDVVSNAYLLCRIADTIEDEPALSGAQKRDYAALFANAIKGDAPAQALADELYPLLSDSTLEAERQLIKDTARVVRVTHGFREPQRVALVRCIRIMSRGMAEFQQNSVRAGLDDLPHLDRYCYHVAGVVGEMLTELFCEYSQRIARHRDEMMRLAVSFGQGLQMTNILKDIWEDRRRDACWLPRSVFREVGFDLAELAPGTRNKAFEAGLAQLIGVARLHLANALEYTLLIPCDERKIRRFCLWALGMAVLTLRKLHAHLDFASGQEVKISRGSVKGTILATNLALGSDWLLKLLFDAFTRSLPLPADRSVAISV